MTNTLLIIDPQNDFCDPKGALSVPGAEADCKRLTEMIARLDSRLNSIHVTMDTHHFFHIAHPVFWVDASGSHPAPYTIITSEMIAAGKWKASVPQYQHYAIEYVATLEKTNKYNLCVWQPHCLIGTWGHDIYGVLSDALIEWERSVPGRVVDYTYKGSNVRTEHYSAIRAEVSDAADPGSRTNFALIERLKGADNVAIAGEALSHCVANTVRDLIACIPAEKLVVLTDVSSNVPGFESLGNDFCSEVERIGVRLMTSVEFLA
ncbi:MAG TPA: isochorismatase family protein [Treponemataceae bacterium]|nr:isochorismatase family protein [Treponemataceae bacterium]